MLLSHQYTFVNQGSHRDLQLLEGVGYAHLEIFPYKNIIMFHVMLHHYPMKKLDKKW